MEQPTVKLDYQVPVVRLKLDELGDFALVTMRTIQAIGFAVGQLSRFGALEASGGLAFAVLPQSLFNQAEQQQKGGA